MSILKAISLMSVLTPQVQAKYVWPAKSDFLEDLYAIQDGVIRFGFTDCRWHSLVPLLSQARPNCILTSRSGCSLRFQFQ